LENTAPRIGYYRTTSLQYISYDFRLFHIENNNIEAVMGDFTLLLDGLIFSEGPRWKDGKLWFSDMHDQKIFTVDLDGNKQLIHAADDDTSGLGFTSDGSLLYVSMQKRKLMRVENGVATTVADLSSLVPFHCNDMIVDAQDRCYVGNFGFDLHGGAEQVSTDLLMIEKDGSVSVAASDLLFPNGTVITPDGKTMIVAETFGARLTAFDIADNGSLSNRRVWADTSPSVPDGICLDAEGAVWVASPSTRDVIRVKEGGEITHRLKPSTNVFACMLGGEDRKTLFALTADESSPHVLQGRRTGKIEMTRVEVPGAGLP
jgi:sugar lactone lactonase YvrE